jgi:2-hydroxychromene-2-carboxylate isomerase
MAGRVTFYFDFGSPYAYLASERIGSMVPDAEWKPFAFPFLLHHHGRLEKAMSRDFPAVLDVVSERAAQRGLPPVSPPPGWPNEIWSLAPLRAAAVADEQGKLREFATAAFRKVFVEGKALNAGSHLHEAARDAGLDADTLDESIERPDIKQRVKDSTEEAIARGVTGIPTVAVGDELFWGDDRLEEAAAAAR